MSSLRLLLFNGLLGLQTAAAAPPALPPDSVILFVASWCAPCRGELQQIEAIAAAATSVTVRVTPIDQSRGTAAMLRGVAPARVWRSAQTMRAYTQSAGSLPYSIMTDAAGRPCATHDRALDPESVRAMLRRCRTR